MAENLNYGTQARDGYFCYNGNGLKCKDYGMLYTWNAAQSACPVGWHLPTSDEFVTLINFVGGSSAKAKGMLKSKTGWIDDEEKDFSGTDDYGFNAIPAGVRNDNPEKYEGEYKDTYFWASNQMNSENSYFMSLGEHDPNSIVYYGHPETAMSVRCVRD